MATNNAALVQGILFTLRPQMAALLNLLQDLEDSDADYTQQNAAEWAAQDIRDAIHHLENVQWPSSRD